jgi:DNA-binding MarR family transcriptional regulator
MKTQPGRKRVRRRFDSLEQEAYLNLWRTYDRLRLLEDRLFGPHGLTAQQYNALRLLRGAHPEPIATLALASRLVSRAPDITRLLDKLAERGLIARDRRESNRRTVLVSITDVGLTLLDDLDAEVRKCNECQLGHLGPDELNELIRLLRRARVPHEHPESEWA